MAHPRPHAQSGCPDMGLGAVTGALAVIMSALALSVVVAIAVPAAAAPRSGVSAAPSDPTGSGATETTSPGPLPAYQCRFDVQNDAVTGADGTASAIGWLGDDNSVVTCLGGSLLIQNGPEGYFRSYGFGIYHGQRTAWTDADGYLPAEVTTFSDGGGVRVAITEFADRITVQGQAYVAVYSRVRFTNTGAQRRPADPKASSAFVALGRAATMTVPPHGIVQDDFVIISDRFGTTAPWPTRAESVDAGGFDSHFAHMRAFWNRQLAGIAHLRLPDVALVDAYESGFITTQISRSSNRLDTGVNGYESEFSHDVVGILTTLFTQGSFADAHTLLLELRNVVGAQGQYVDGLWTYALPWAVYLMKAGDESFVRDNFDTAGPLGGPAQPSIEDSAHAIASARTGPMGTMEATNDIDTQGYWTVDDYEALLGLAAYHYIAATIGEAAEARWAESEYRSLLGATNNVLAQTIASNHLDYLPCSLSQPNTANRCNNPRDANWTSPFGFGSWAWEASLLGAVVSGPGVSLIDATYAYGFGRLRGILPADTTGGFPGDYYSSAYDAAQGTSGLASADHRDQGIRDYEFMIANSQSGPYSWWESSSAPAAGSPWVGRHPAMGQGSSPHAWGIAGANKVLLDSVVAQRADGTLLVGRGIPAQWLGHGPVEVSNYPISAGRRIGIRITSHGATVSLTLRGAGARGPVLFELPAFVDDISSASIGRVDETTGTIALPKGVRQVTATLKSLP